MTAAGKHIIDDFQKLSEPEKREVLVDILRISGSLDESPISEAELISSADALFAEYDRQEANE